MQKRILNIHRYFYWYYHQPGIKVRFAAIHGAFIFLFLLLFLPFGSSQNNLHFWGLALYFLSFGVVWCLSLLFVEFLLKRQNITEFDLIDFTKTRNDLWLWLLKLMVINSCFYLWFAITCKDCVSFLDFIEIQYSNFLMFLFTYTGFTFKAKTSLLNSKISTNNQRTGEVMIKGKGKEDFIQVAIEQLAYAKACDNYTEVYILKGGDILKRIIRIPMKLLLQQLEPYDNIKRTHRSYIVNQDYVIASTKKYIILGLGLDQVQVPVSSSYAHQFDKEPNRVSKL